MKIKGNYLNGLNKGSLEIEAQRTRPKVNLIISGFGEVVDNSLYNSIYGENDKKFAEANAIQTPEKLFDKSSFNLGYFVGRYFR